MYQKDFILRMIETVGKMIAVILGLIRKNDLSEARELIDDIYLNYLKEDAASFNIIPEEDLTQKLIEEHDYTNGHLEILAELFFAEAELRTAEGKISESIAFSRKSLILFEFIDREEKTYYPDRIKKMEILRNTISG